MSRSVTVQARLVAVGDQWQGNLVTGVVQSWQPQNIDITVTDGATTRSRTVTINRNQWLVVQRG
jgi:hypothetical protein